jgi:hypothetical protein
MGQRFTKILSLVQRQAMWAIFTDVEKAQGLTGTTSLGHAAAVELTTRATGGDVAAQALRDAIVTAGCCAEVDPYISERKGTIFTKVGAGPKVARKVREIVGVRRKEQRNGKEVQVWQHSLWWTLTWDEFEAMVRSYLAQGLRMQEQAAAWKEVLALRNQFPDTATPGEACERAGLDPKAFDLRATGS